MKALLRYSPQSILGGRQLRPPPIIESNRRRRGIDPALDSPDAVSWESARAPARRTSPAVWRLRNRRPLINHNDESTARTSVDEVVEKFTASLA
jgi:hypothetical protein